MPQKQREDLGDEDQAIYGLGETRDYWYKSTPRHSIRYSLILSIPTGYLWDQCPMGSRFLRSKSMAMVFSWNLLRELGSAICRSRK